MKNVSIIQSAITQRDWCVSGCVVRERDRGQQESTSAPATSDAP